MPDPSVETLLANLRRRYGDRLMPYGTSSDEEHGTGFRLKDLPATFSAITLDGTLPFGHFDVQIESYPPGEYVWTGDCEIEGLLEIVADIERGVWPHETLGWG